MGTVLIKSKQERNTMDSQLTDTNNGISRGVLQSLKAMLSKPSDIYKLFFLFTKKLNRFFPISQSSLIVFSKQDNKLKVIAMKGDKGARKGLTLTLPETNSLLYKVFADGHFYTKHHPQKFDGNFIEEKILKDNDARSLAILPIVQNGSKCGLICLSSPNQDAFRSFENGSMDEILENFSKNMIKRMPSSCI